MVLLEAQGSDALLQREQTLVDLSTFQPRLAVCVHGVRSTLAAG